MLDDRSRYPFPRIRLLSMTRHDCFPSISDLLFSPKCSHNLIDRVTDPFRLIDFRIAYIFSSVDIPNLDHELKR